MTQVPENQHAEDLRAQFESDFPPEKYSHRRAFAGSHGYWYSHTNKAWIGYQAGYAAGVAAERDLLRDFARSVMQAWPEGGIDGGELQDIALAHGLLRPAEPPPDWDGCNFYERTELIK